MRVESRKSLLAKVHIAKKALGLDDETYRALLSRVTRKDSAADCTVPQLTAVVVEMRKKGWNPPEKPKTAKGKTSIPAKGKTPLMGKITAYLAEAGRPDAYADGMAKRMYKRDSVAFCTVPELTGLVAALAKDAKRHGRPV